MVDDDKKIVNTEEQNLPVNPEGSADPEESPSEQPAHTVNTVTSEDSTKNEENSSPNVVNDTGMNRLKKQGRVEGDEMDLDKKIPE